MAKRTLSVTTHVGPFTRTTNSGYKYVVVWRSPRAKAAHAQGNLPRRGVSSRWAHDRGYGVTWHFRHPRPTRYRWDDQAELVGIFEVGV